MTDRRQNACYDTFPAHPEMDHCSPAVSRRRHRLLGALCICATLAACAGKAVQDKPIPVNIPVAVPCALPRPTQPMPLAQTYPHWASMDIKQKAAAVSRQALNWQTYAQQLHAATAACP